MTISKQDPTYKAIIVSQATGKKYEITNVMISCDLAERENTIAKSAKVEFANVQCDGKYLNGVVKVRDRIFIYAHDGETSGEVFRGFIWTKRYTSKTEKELTVSCYDNLIYFQESEDSQFFASGQSTADIAMAVCRQWGVSLSYAYESITHEKLILKGALSDIFLTDLLGEVKKKQAKNT